MDIQIFASEIANAVKSHGLYEEVSVKTASEDQCAIAQEENAKISHVITDSIKTEAAVHGMRGAPNVTQFVCKMAHVHNNAIPNRYVQLKIASALTVDEALSRAVVQDGLNDTARMKLASMRAYGREVFMEILRGVL
jgi:ribosomal 30S subunit maturation factor RimM